jgi:hypothetical protein
MSEAGKTYAELVEEIAGEAPEGTRRPWVEWAKSLLQRLDDFERRLLSVEATQQTINERYTAVIFSVVKMHADTLRLDLATMREELLAEIRQTKCSHDEKTTP